MRRRVGSVGWLLVAVAITVLAVPAAQTEPPSGTENEGYPFGVRRACFPHWMERGARQEAIANGLAWLAAHQASDGHWAPVGDGRPGHDVGLTGLTLLAFLDAGYGPGDDHRYGEAVERGLAYLVGRQDAEGCVGARKMQHYVYHHAYAAQALVEAYGLFPSDGLRGAAQRALDFSSLARNPYFAWRYGVKAGDNDTSVTAVMLLPFLAARRINADFANRGSVRPLDIDELVFDGAAAWIDKMTDSDNGRVGYIQRGGAPARGQKVVDAFPGKYVESTTALALACRLIGRLDGYDEESLAKGMSLIARRVPVGSPSGAVDFYYWYYGSLASYHMGGRHWDYWRTSLPDLLIEMQQRDGTHDGVLGSWDPVGAWGMVGGRVYTTAIAVLALLTESRFPRLQDRQLDRAKAALEQLRDGLKKWKTPNQVLLDRLVDVAEAYHGLLPPPAPTKGEVPESTRAKDRARTERRLQREYDRALSRHRSAIKALPKERAKLRGAAEKAFLKAFRIRRVEKPEPGNRRLGVNLLAARLLASTGNPALSPAIRETFESRVLGAEHDVPVEMYREAFGALGRLNDAESLRWLADRVLARDVRRARDAEIAGCTLEAMRAFEDVPPDVGRAVVGTLVEVYAPMEAAAGAAPGDAAWKTLGANVLATLRRLAGTPVDEEGQPLATVAAYRTWLGSPGR